MAKANPPTRSPLLAEQAPQMTIGQAIKLAGENIDAGKLPEAEGILREVLKKQPKNPHALHLMGLVAHYSGRGELAAKLIGEAISLQPLVPQFHANRCEICRRLGRLDEAVSHGELAVKLAPNFATAHSNLGLAHFSKGELDLAEACQRRALKLDAKLVQALNNLGSICRERKDRAGALDYYRRALDCAPNYVEALNNLGAVLTELKQPEAALAPLLKAVKIRPGYADGHFNLGNVFMQMEAFGKAAAAFGQALKLAPGLARAMVGLARALLEMDNLREARKIADAALALHPANAEVLALSADIHARAGLYDQAGQDYEKAQSLNPQLASAHLGMGRMQLELGRFEDAEASFRRVVEIDPAETAAYAYLAQVRRIRPGDPTLALLEQEKTQLGKLPPARAMLMHFALGKAYDDLAQYEQAFAHFSAGCRLKRERVRYSADAHDLACRNIRDFFNRETIDALRGGGDPSAAPIFILGMPRSGTTLVETILASHPDVHAGGEQPHLLAIASQPLAGAAGPGYPQALNGLTQQDLVLMGARYLDRLREHSPQAERITDKMPANYLALGLIHLMLPNAKIIHVRRDAADTCLSCYTKLFTHNQYQTYDLGELGRYYVNYAELMQHWREVLPDDAFYEVRYEDLVSDSAAQIRSLVAYCGLGWSDACLEFHSAARGVRTASVAQVREPLHGASVGRWRHYREQLQPLFERLGVHAPDEVRAGNS